MSDRRNNVGTWTAAAREIYEGKVGIEALARAGRNRNLKGVIHEVMVKDTFNADPLNMLAGKAASLTKSTTAVRDDIIIKQAGKIVGRMQLKDTAGSIGDTIRQVSSGKYQRTALMGTKETTQAFSAAAKRAGVTQKMGSTGFSSSDTARIANKALGSSAGGLTASSVAKVAGSTGAIGAALSGGIEVLISGAKLANGEIDAEEFAGNVAREAAGGGIAAGAGAAAATVASAGAATLLGTTAPLWVPAAVGVGAAMAVGCAVKSLWDSIFD